MDELLAAMKQGAAAIVGTDRFRHLDLTEMTTVKIGDAVEHVYRFYVWTHKGVQYLMDAVTKRRAGQITPRAPVPQYRPPAFAGGSPLVTHSNTSSFV